MSFNDGTIFAMVEAQLSTSGLLPLKVAHRLGCEVVFVTNDLERYQGVGNVAEIFSERVSKVIEGDTNSSAGILAAVEGLLGSGRLRALYTHCDYNLPFVAESAAALGLPGLSPTAAGTARDKLETRRVCLAAGIPAPRFAYVTTESEAVAAARDLGFPCVVKPMTESASTGVHLAFTEAEVGARFGEIAARPYDARGQRRRAGALVEEYALGYEVSVETVTYEGRTTLIGVTDKQLSPAPHFAEMGDTFPSALPERVTGALARTALDALAAIGFDFGAAHTEVRMTADGPRLIEINARIAGASIADLVELALGFPYREQIVRMHLGERPDLTPTRHGGAASRYLMARERGTVRAVHGTGLARRVEGVANLEVEAAPGHQVAPPTSNHDQCGLVVATAETSAEAARRADTALAQIHLDIRPGG
ncbi:ATP-grasp domain-containing protein [Streptomyces zagrosensis]|uniref:Biotin carboxylase n=1 Tax=Streptomyces zagrosensis TaxID=1042984 RepID=A0A7W9QHY4_9ACTN|nr:ATP-grasp domain-containing protein [Streptomyces zagrosensis]MBB5940309.1 biotin carboxylase [Streptomyces zagrosensis]